MPQQMELSNEERAMVERLRRLSPQSWLLALGGLMALEAADAAEE